MSVLHMGNDDTGPHLLILLLIAPFKSCKLKWSCNNGKNNQVSGLKSFEPFQIMFCMTVTAVCLHCEIAHCV